MQTIEINGVIYYLLQDLGEMVVVVSKASMDMTGEQVVYCLAKPQ